MSDYRVAQEVDSSPPPTAQAPKDKSRVLVSEVEPPFTSYEQDKGKPFLVDHYELGSLWEDADGGYANEVQTINSYLDYLIESGEVNNTIDAVKNKLKSIEKVIGINKDARTAVRVGQIAAHVEYLMKLDNIKKTAAKYGKV